MRGGGGGREPPGCQGPTCCCKKVLSSQSLARILLSKHKPRPWRGRAGQGLILLPTAEHKDTSLGRPLSTIHVSNPFKKPPSLLGAVTALCILWGASDTPVLPLACLLQGILGDSASSLCLSSHPPLQLGPGQGRQVALSFSHHARSTAALAEAAHGPPLLALAPHCFFRPLAPLLQSAKQAERRGHSQPPLLPKRLPFKPPRRKEA